MKHYLLFSIVVFVVLLFFPFNNGLYANTKKTSVGKISLNNKVNTPSIPSRNSVAKKNQALMAKEQPRIRKLRAGIETLKTKISNGAKLQIAIENEEYVYFKDKFGNISLKEFLAIKAFLSQNGGDFIVLLAKAQPYVNKGVTNGENSIGVLNNAIVSINYYYEETLSGLGFLRPLKKMKFLGIFGCRISSISDIGPHPDLEILRLDQNRIVKIEGLQGCPALVYLGIGVNGISKIENIRSLNMLEALDVRGNNLRSFSDIAYLDMLFVKNPKTIKTVNLNDNPYPCNDPEIRNYILNHPEIYDNCH